MRLPAISFDPSPTPAEARAGSAVTLIVAVESQSKCDMGDGRGGVYSQPAECVNWFSLVQKRIVKRDKTAVFLKIPEFDGTEVKAPHSILALFSSGIGRILTNGRIRTAKSGEREGEAPAEPRL